MTETSTSLPTDPGEAPAPRDQRPLMRLISRITKLELVVAAVIAAIMLLLVALEPEIVEAPFENGRSMLFTIGGTVLAAIAFGVMLALRVPAIVRVIVLVVPFALVNWWLISPYFIDDVVDEEFTTSIAEQLPADEPADAATTDADDTTTDATTGGDVTATDETTSAEPEDPAADAAPPADAVETDAEPPAPTGPVLLGAGQFVGLAGHSGVGDAGLFENPDGTLTLRFENFDIDNGPDLEVYIVPGADQTSPGDGSLHLGALKGNVGNQNYEIVDGVPLAPGDYTVLVWCEAFSVEFVGATLTV